ncbi:MAG: hypothetical protein WCO84_05855 [bacterium]
MKATLEFNLPEDQNEFSDATEGYKFKLVLEDLLQEVLRPIHKHGQLPKFEEFPDGLSEEHKKILEIFAWDLACKMIPDLLNEYGVRLN